MEPIVVQNQVVITAGKAKWIPEVKVVQGKMYVKVSKWTRGFVQLTTGKALDLRKCQQNKANCSFLEQLCKARDAAVDNLYTLAMTVDSDSETTASPKKKRRKAKEEHCEMIDAVTIIHIGDRPVNVLCSGVRSNVLWVELEKDILEALRDGVQGGEDGPGHQRRRKRK